MHDKVTFLPMSKPNINIYTVSSQYICIYITLWSVDIYILNIDTHRTLIIDTSLYRFGGDWVFDLRTLIEVVRMSQLV